MLRYLILLVLSLILIPNAAGEKLTLSTYYPAPHGAYDRLQLVPRENLSEPCKIGTIYVTQSGYLQYCYPGQKEGQWSNIGTHVERGALELSEKEPYTITFNVPFSDLPLIQVYAEVDVPDGENKKSIISYSTGVGIFDINPRGFKISYFDSPKTITVHWVAVGN